jgi:hypothetical protein
MNSLRRRQLKSGFDNAFSVYQSPIHSKTNFLPKFKTKSNGHPVQDSLASTQHSPSMSYLRGQNPLQIVAQRPDSVAAEEV